MFGTNQSRVSTMRSLGRVLQRKKKYLNFVNFQVTFKGGKCLT